MAIDLIKRNQCHNFIIIKKSSSGGRTWHDNKYRGCCRDVWSTLYGFSFEQNPDWTREYSGQEEILVGEATSFQTGFAIHLYLRNVAQKYNLDRYIRFNTSVDAATWDDTKNRWKVDVKVMGGKDAEFSPAYSIECNFLVSSVSQLNQPRYLDIKGPNDFQGKIMHSARWNWSYRLEGKSMGIIGNGTYPKSWDEVHY
jgi:cation diffusion facilitator CzcD-associated flavoprotein CzcO